MTRLEFFSDSYKAFANLKISDSNTAVDPEVQQQLTQLVHEMEQLLQQLAVAQDPIPIRGCQAEEQAYLKLG